MIEVGMGRYALAGWSLGCTALVAWLILAGALDGASSSAAPETGALRADIPAAPVPAELLSFDSEHLALRSSFPCRLDLLAGAAEDACARVHALTDLPIPDGPLPIHISDSEEAVRAVAEEHGVSPLPRALNGGFYGHKPLVIVRDNPALPQTICHEVVHWMVEASSPGCPPAVNEGLAELVAEETIFAAAPEVANLALPRDGLPPMPWSVANRKRNLTEHLAGAPALSLANLSSLESFWGLEVGSYWEPRYSYSLHRDLAWCLMRVWIREGEAVGMPLKNLCRVVHDSQPSLRGLLRDDAAYERLEAAWKRQIAATANGYLPRR